MEIVIVGTGYVGLVTGACFAEMGHHVTCVDIDPEKVAGLQEGEIPIYEPGLKQLVLRNTKEQRLFFTVSLAEAMENAEIIFIAVGTPPSEDGSADIVHVLAVAREIGATLTDYKVVVTKSTVPVGTAEKVKKEIELILKNRKSQVEFDISSNPEFLKEGSAVDDFMKPDRIVIGVENDRARQVMQELYKAFCRNHDRILFMGIRDAEMTKYASNSMLATKISFMNEVANICDRIGVDVEKVRLGIGSDNRIGYSFIYPGCGYGGSCLPKDVQALIHTAVENDFEPSLLKSVHLRNEEQKHVLFRKIVKRFDGDLNGLTFGIWGIAFKPGTDDIREASATILIRELIEAGAHIKAYDPEALDAARSLYPTEWFESKALTLVRNQYEALEEVDALTLVTEWKPFRYPDLNAMKSMMRTPVVFDGRNQYDPASLKEEGFEYYGIGR